MKKEYFVVIAIAFFIFAYVLDWISGPFNITLRNPYQFLSEDVFLRYPFTAVSIAIRTVALLISVLVCVLLLQKKYLQKGIFLLILSALAQLYAIQQIATGMLLLSLQWILSLAFAGLTIIVPGVMFFVIGFLHWGHDQVSGNIYNVETDTRREEGES